MTARQFVEKKRKKYAAIGLTCVALGRDGKIGKLDLAELLDGYAKEILSQIDETCLLEVNSRHEYLVSDQEEEAYDADLGRTLHAALRRFVEGKEGNE